MYTDSGDKGLCYLGYNLPPCRASVSARRDVSVLLSILAKALLVGANTVKGAGRPGSAPKAAPSARRREEKRASVARSSPVVGREAEPGGRVGGELLGLTLSDQSG